MKIKDVNCDPLATQDLSTPEHLLWLAVIDKALTDYVKFENVLSPRERGALKWFLFDKRSRPNNLQYICEQLFDQDDVAEQIRERAKQIKSGTTPLEDISLFFQKRYNLRIKSRFF